MAEHCVCRFPLARVAPGWCADGVVSSAVSAPEPGSRPEAEFFRSPSSIAQRRYEALRAHLYEGLSQAEAAARFGYTPATIASLARDFRSGHLVFFPPEVPRRRRSPAKERARARIVELRQIGHSVDDIADALKIEGMALNRTGISEVLAEEGFGRLKMRPFRERILPRRAILPVARLVDFAELPELSETLAAGLFLAIPTWSHSTCPAWSKPPDTPARGSSRGSTTSCRSSRSKWKACAGSPTWTTWPPTPGPDCSPD